MPLAAVNQKHDKCSRCSVAACLRYSEIFSDDFVLLRKNVKRSTWTVHTSTNARLTSVAILIHDPDCHQNLFVHWPIANLP